MQALKNGKHSEDNYVDKRTPVGVDYVRSSVVIEVGKIHVCNNSEKKKKPTVCVWANRGSVLVILVSRLVRTLRFVVCLYDWEQPMFVVQEGPFGSEFLPMSFQYC